MRAVIMAGGAGKRLRPITCTRPKPMVPLLGAPVIDYCVALLKKHSITDISVTLHYLPNMIKDHLGDGADRGVDISYSTEDVPLGTAGSVKKAAGSADERVIVISGDGITDIDLTKAICAHEKGGAPITILLKKVQAPTEYGVALRSENGMVSRYIEKPVLSEVFSDLANTGIYIIEPEILRMIPDGVQFDFSNDLFPMLLNGGVDIFGFETEGYWCDIGDIAQYMSAQRDMLEGRCTFESAAKNNDGIFIEDGALISPKAILRTPCYICAGAEIAGGALVDSFSVIGKGARIGRSSSIKRSVLMEGARVRESAELRGAVVCEGAEIGGGASAFEQSCLGAQSRLGPRSTLAKGVLVWPEKMLEAERQYTEHVVWDEGGKKLLESASGGYCDFDLTPEKAARAGAALVSTKKLPCSLTVATDGSQRAVMLKYALISGAVSQGADITDAGVCTRSALEFAVRQLNQSGAVIICSRPGDPHAVEISILDRDGIAIDAAHRRRFDQEYSLGMKRPVTSERLGTVERYNGAHRAYEAALCAQLPAVSAAGYTVVIAADELMFDSVARILLPLGFKVLLAPGRSGEKLEEAMIYSGAELGFFINGEGELSQVIYEEQRLGNDELTFILSLEAVQRGCSEFALPVSVPEEYIEALKAEGAAVVRTANERSKRQRTALSGGMYIRELFEAEAAIARLCVLGANGSLKSLAERIPAVELKESGVACTWRDMGRVLRSLVETERNSRVELIDGVKVASDRGWVLIGPDRDMTSCRVVAGSFDEEYARELTDIYTEKIRAVLAQHS